MARVKALFGFNHDGAKKKGQVFEVSDKVAEQLLQRGMVSRLADAAPRKSEAGDKAKAGDKASTETKATAPTAKKAASAKVGK